jgi:spore coat polysaccharide biosynthesis protein SpsF
MQNIVAIVQTRLGSTRLPNKALMELSGKPIIYHVCNRLMKSKFINLIVVATTMNKNDGRLYKWAIQNSLSCFRGDENNVLSRYYFAALEAKADIIVRITGDDPFKDVTIIDNVIEMLIREDLDFACNNFPPTFPEGLDVEVFTFATLKKAFENSIDDFEKEHVTQYFYRNPNFFKIKNFFNENDVSHLRLTVDTQNDLLLASEIYKRLYENDSYFGLNEILNLAKTETALFEINQKEKRSTMYSNK